VSGARQMAATGWDPTQVAAQWKSRIVKEELVFVHKVQGRPLSEISDCEIPNDDRFDDLRSELSRAARRARGETSQADEGSVRSFSTRRSSHVSRPSQASTALRLELEAEKERRAEAERAVQELQATLSQQGREAKEADEARRKKDKAAETAEKVKVDDNELRKQAGAAVGKAIQARAAGDKARGKIQTPRGTGTISSKY